MTAGQAIQKGFMLSISTWPLAAIIAAFNNIGGFSFLLILGPNPTPDEVGQRIIYLVFFILIVSMAWIYMQGGVLGGVLSKIKTDGPDLAEFVGNCNRFFARLVAVNSLVGGIAMLGWVLGAVLVGVMVALGGGNNIFFNILGVLFMFIAVIGSIIAAVPFMLGQYVIVIEDGKLWASVKKSAMLAKAVWGKLFWLGFLLFVSMAVISLLVGLLTLLLGKAIPAGWLLSSLNVIINSVVNCVIGLFLTGTIMHFVLSMAQEGTAANPPAQQ
ncbi:MAG: hypothetical protein NC924_07595 [Candidatus Omnitrophica bacterium]|nr:hypothetical protein [Candidatus Omnitrophota bacterium]